MDTWKLTLIWVAAVLITTALTWQIVSFADSQVSARPVEVVAVESTSSTGDTTATTFSGTTLTTSGSTTSTSPTTSSTSPGAPTTDDQWSVRTVTSTGGTVVVRHRPEEVELQAATPAPGFDVEIDDAGPDRVRVDFESDDSDVRVEVEWSNGELEVTISD